MFQRRFSLLGSLAWMPFLLQCAVAAHAHAQQIAPIPAGNVPQSAKAASAQAQANPQRAPRPYAHKPDLENVAYGPHPRNVLDLWKATSERPTPLVVFFHPGGFSLGDKTWIPPILVETCLSRGVSVATANYRYSFQAHWPAQVEDSARAIQFLRLHAGEWNLDPESFAATGSSAGAGISIWLGFHGDLADPKSDDPVKRQSTRLCVFGFSNGQTTYDPREIAGIIGEDNARKMGRMALAPLFGLRKDEDVMKATAAYPLFEDSSGLKHVKRGDPPVFMYYAAPLRPLTPDTPQDEVMHNIRFGMALKERMDKLGIECVLRNVNDYPPGQGSQHQGDMVEFMMKHFPKPSSAPAAGKTGAAAPGTTQPAVDGERAMVHGGQAVDEKKTGRAPGTQRRGPAGPPMEQGIKRKAQFPPTLADVKYGPHDANVLDLWLAESKRPAPLLVAFHGGGFRQGSKDQFSTVLFDECRAAGIAFATVEYRLSQVAPYPAPMVDCARAVQFLRHNAKQWHLDPARLAATGGSAGAGISLWLAFHDDLANPQSEDPVARESTRLTCALVTGIQSTYDPREFRKIVPGNAYDAQPLKQLFGLPDSWNWDTDKVDAALDARLREASPITHLSKDDIPVFVVSYQSMNVPGDPHHSNHAKYLKQQMDKLGIECVIRMDTDYTGGMAEAHKDMAQWMKTHFQ